MNDLEEPNSQLLTQGWLSGIKHCPSPNFDARPDGQEVDLLVIHNISLPPESYGTDCVEAFFCNSLDCSLHPYFSQLVDLRVSSHFFISRSGVLSQFVSTEQRAWHAGVSSFDGHERCNDFAIGVELEGSDETAYTMSQYVQLASLTKVLQNKYPNIDSSRIVGHSDIAPQRKSDPGSAFDWLYYRQLLAVEQSESEESK